MQKRRGERGQSDTRAYSFWGMQDFGFQTYIFSYSKLQFTYLLKKCIFRFLISLAIEQDQISYHYLLMISRIMSSVPSSSGSIVLASESAYYSKALQSSHIGHLLHSRAEHWSPSGLCTQPPLVHALHPWLQSPNMERTLLWSLRTLPSSAKQRWDLISLPHHQNTQQLLFLGCETTQLIHPIIEKVIHKQLINQLATNNM